MLNDLSGNNLETSWSSQAVNEDILVPITAYYDVKRQLVEISIVGSTVVPSRQIIRALSLSVPYQSMLTRLTFRRSGLNAELVYEIKKLLPISNICEIIFDDSYVREGNYYILLEQISQLKYLSLNRCEINDEVCKKIFEKIGFGDPAGKTLQILELGSNEITDDAAIFIGAVLRSNRCLVHLNLSGNRVTDSGFISILDSLMEFPLTSVERSKTRQKRIRYLQSKEAVYAKCLSDLKFGTSEDLGSSISARKLNMKRSCLKQKRHRSLEEDAEMMTKQILGDFHDPFSPNDVEFKDCWTYSKGNLTLCSINMAYNDLEYLSVQKLWEVLRYQDGRRSISKSAKDTGLIRVTLDGNNIPKACSELEGIDFYLKKIIQLNAEWARKKHKSSQREV